MSDDTRVYISVESNSGRLIVDGSLVLWRELVDALSGPAAEPRSAEPEVVDSPRAVAGAAS